MATSSYECAVQARELMGVFAKPLELCIHHGVKLDWGKMRRSCFRRLVTPPAAFPIYNRFWSLSRVVRLRQSLNVRIRSCGVWSARIPAGNVQESCMWKRRTRHANTVLSHVAQCWTGKWQREFPVSFREQTFQTSPSHVLSRASPQCFLETSSVLSAFLLIPRGILDKVMAWYCLRFIPIKLCRTSVLFEIGNFLSFSRTFL